MNNNKKEYPINSLEQDCISKKSRQILAYVSNIKGIKKFAKTSSIEDLGVLISNIWTKLRYESINIICPSNSLI